MHRKQSASRRTFNKSLLVLWGKQSQGSVKLYNFKCIICMGFIRGCPFWKGEKLYWRYLFNQGRTLTSKHSGFWGHTLVLQKAVRIKCRRQLLKLEVNLHRVKPELLMYVQKLDEKIDSKYTKVGLSLSTIMPNTKDWMEIRIVLADWNKLLANVDFLCLSLNEFGDESSK